MSRYTRLLVVASAGYAIGYLALAASSGPAKPVPLPRPRPPVEAPPALPPNIGLAPRPIPIAVYRPTPDAPPPALPRPVVRSPEPRAPTSTQAAPEPPTASPRHRSRTGASLCARHGLRQVWTDNGRSWRCRH